MKLSFIQLEAEDFFSLGQHVDKLSHPAGLSDPRGSGVNQ